MTSHQKDKPEWCEAPRITTLDNPTNDHNGNTSGTTTDGPSFKTNS